jgi:hypothetical protein
MGVSRPKNEAFKIYIYIYMYIFLNFYNVNEIIGFTYISTTKKIFKISVSSSNRTSILEYAWRD